MERLLPCRASLHVQPPPTSLAIGYQDGYAIGDLDGQTKIASVADDDVGVLAGGRTQAISGDKHRPAVYLPHPDESFRIDIQARRHLRPGFVITTGHTNAEAPAARGKKVRRKARERPAG
jgi:hypothetical protein